MTDPLPLLFACLLSTLSSLTILRVLSRPLAGLLERLCPDKESAAFWRSYAQLMLALAPLLCVLLLDLFVHGGDLVTRLRYGLIASLGGLLVGLWIVGRRLGQFIATAEIRRSAP
ncbi:MAG: hypothetical protein JNL84_13815 [Candidatus Accumulibacter sp.]|nr:hypothetical protein [Accumulibacter sp.]